MRNTILLSGAIALLIVACKSDPASNLKPLDLMKYGIPLTVMAPDSAKVETMDLIVQNDVTIKKGDDYFIQLYASDASTTDLKQVKADQLEEVKANPYFSGIVSEDENGFVYKKQIDSTNVNYGFKYIKLQGDKEYIFQTGLIGKFSEESVMAMYNAVK